MLVAFLMDFAISQGVFHILEGGNDGLSILFFVDIGSGLAEVDFIRRRLNQCRPTTWNDSKLTA